MKKAKTSSRPALLGGDPAFPALVPITAPTVPPLARIKARTNEILKTGLVTNGRYVREFEEKCRRYLGVKHAVAVNSCTTGMVLVMKALELKGKAVLPSFTFCATGHAAVWAGLEPLFVDCDRETFNVDPARVEEALTPDASCILAVHVFGNPAAAAELERLARARGLRLIFDAAHGFGARSAGRKVGGFGDAEVFSLSPTKLLTAAEGGLVATNDDEIARKVRLGRNYGNPGNYDCEFAGTSARMSEFHAIFGIESLAILDANVRKRNKLAATFRRLLGRLPGLSFQTLAPDSRSTYKDFSIVVDEGRFGMGRDALSDALAAERIETRKYFWPPVHRQRAYAAWRGQEDRLPVTMWLSRSALSLPLFSHMAPAAAERICEAVRRIHANAEAVRRALADRKA